MFAKFWQPGQVKTRLAAEIGSRRAAEIYRTFVATLLRRFSRTGDRRVLVYSPAERAEDFTAAAGPAWNLQPQAAGDLGQRMQCFFTESFAAGADRVVLIGSDSPDLPPEYVDRAFAALHSRPVVLGPSWDGGYYLIGLRGILPQVFDRIPWSSGEVWQQTVQRLSELNCPFAELPPWYDVDDAADLRRLKVELENAPTIDADLQSLRQRLDQFPDSWPPPDKTNR